MDHGADQVMVDQDCQLFLDLTPQTPKQIAERMKDRFRRPIRRVASRLDRLEPGEGNQVRHVYGSLGYAIEAAHSPADPRAHLSTGYRRTCGYLSRKTISEVEELVRMRRTSLDPGDYQAVGRLLDEYRACLVRIDKRVHEIEANPT